MQDKFDTKRLKEIITDIEDINLQKESLSDHIKAILQQAKVEGFKIEIIKKVIVLRKMTKEEIEEQDQLVEDYMKAVEG